MWTCEDMVEYIGVMSKKRSKCNLFPYNDPDWQDKNKNWCSIWWCNQDYIGVREQFKFSKDLTLIEIDVIRSLYSEYFLDYFGSRLECFSIKKRSVTSNGKGILNEGVLVSYMDNKLGTISDLRIYNFGRDASNPVYDNSTGLIKGSIRKPELRNLIKYVDNKVTQDIETSPFLGNF